MKVLIVNAHSENQTGRAKFQQFHCRLREVLKETIYYGNDYEEHIRRRQNLEDLLFEEDSDYTNQKNLERFRLYTHVVIDGQANIRPWNPIMKDVVLLIRMCLREGTRLAACGFSCLALYFTLALGSEVRWEPGMHVNPATGDIFCEGIKRGNCGIHSIRHATENKSFVVKNHQQAVMLPTKMHYACMAALAGSPLLKTTKFPFALYCTNTWMCNPACYVKQHLDVLIETDCKLPLAYTYRNAIGIINGSRSMINVLACWVAATNEIVVRKVLRRSDTAADDLNIDNQLKKPRRSRPTTATISRTFTYASRPPSSSIYGKHPLRTEQIPVVRCSGPYLTQDEFYMKRIKQSSSRALSRTYMRHDVKAQEHDIQNYVTRSYSRPPSNYQYRTIDKSKWLGKRPFLLA